MMMRRFLWSGLGLVAPLNALLMGRAPAGVTGISIDTRTLAPGDLFFAIKGEASDGHDYVAAAFANGAAAAVVDEEHAPALRDLGPLYVVHDTLVAMQSLGRAARARGAPAVVAVTGSVGKTGTKEALRLVLSAQGTTHASAASYNNHWGVPLTLCRMPQETKFGVFEIGMNHAGEITPLVALVRPHVAVITTIAPVHLEFFASLDAIADAKGEIFSGLERGGTAIINRDIPQYEHLSRLAVNSPAGRVLSFGVHDAANARLDDVLVDEKGSQVKARILGKDLVYRLGAPGRHMAMNSLAVLLAVEALGGDIERSAQDLGAFGAPKGRGEQMRLQLLAGDFTLIDESYNANPTSMRAALDLLGQTLTKGRRIAVLGDMLELGPDAGKLHAELASAVIEGEVNLLFAAGPLMKNLYDATPEPLRGAWAERADGIEAALIAAIQPGDVVMIKGSNGSRMGPIVSKLKELFAPRDDQRSAQG